MVDDSKLTMKSMLVKLLYEKGEAWDYELVQEIQEKSKKTSDYWKWVIRFWTIELAASNIFKVTEAAVDDGSHFGIDKVVYRFQMTTLGKERAEELLI